MAKVSSELVRMMSETPVLPLNVKAYADAVMGYVDQVQAQNGQLLADNGVSIGSLRSAVENFQQVAAHFQQRLQNVDTSNPLEVRMYNDQMMQVERAFIDSNGVPQQSLYKNLIIAPSKQDSYSGSAFPGLANLLFDINEAPNVGERWEEVKQHIATLTFVVHSAASALKPVTQFN